jgi:glutathione reductase (NADPH)
MSDFDFDLLVIGAGSGGVRAARMSAGFGAKVGIIEDRYLGGTCVNVGCVPKKLYYYASHFSEYFNDAGGFGWKVGASEFDWETLKSNRKTEISRLNGIYGNLLNNTGCEIINGRGVIKDANTVTVGDKDYTAAKILIAVGGWPFIPSIPGKELAISSNEVFDLPELPNTMVIVGGGYIAVEFACIFAGLGVNVHLVYRGKQLLKQLDNDVSDFMLTEIKHHGIEVHLETDVASIEAANGSDKTVALNTGDSVVAQTVLYATGRKPKFDGLGLENVEITYDRQGKIAVDEWYQTETPSVFALGDITAGPELTPVALAEGMVFARHWFDGSDKVLDYSNIATAIFTQPNVATVGHTEAQAAALFDEIDVYESDFRHLKHTLTDNKSRTYMKLIVDVATDRVVGAHMVGDEAGEIVQGLAVAIKAGATKAIFDETIGIHPTAAEEFVTMRTAARRVKQ